MLLLIFLLLSATGCPKSTNRGVVGADTWAARETPTVCERLDKFQRQEMDAMMADRRNFDMEAFQKRQTEHTLRLRQEYGLSALELHAEIRRHCNSHYD